MLASPVEGIDLFKIADGSISGWMPDLKIGMSSVRQPFVKRYRDA
jgi:hypothetical protein